MDISMPFFFFFFFFFFFLRLLFFVFSHSWVFLFARHFWLTDRSAMMR